MFPYLPYEIIEKILSFLDIISKEIFLYNIYPENIYIIRNEKINFIQHYFDNQIIDIFGGVKKMISYPFIQFQQKFIGLDYIDNISINDTHFNIMIGIDDYERPFLVITYKYSGENIVECLFQRYTYQKKTWSNGSRYSKHMCCYGYFINNGRLDERTVQNIHHLINNNFNIESF